MGASPPDSRTGFQLLREYVRPKPPQEKCDLCAAPVPPLHQHLLEPGARQLLCACQACSMLFSAPGAKYKRVPRNIRLMANFSLRDEVWEDLAIPINMAYFYRDEAAGEAKACYPGPAGATESLLSLDAWQEIVAANPVLRKLEPDVEGLLVNRLGAISGSADPEYFVLPIDECFRLVGLIRTHWRGLSGGAEMWTELAQFFASLRERATVVKEAAHA